VESTLKRADLLDRAPGRTFQSDTADSIRNAQTQLNTDTRLSPDRMPLKIDGLVNPGGPTETSTRSIARDVVKNTPRLPVPKPTAVATPTPATPMPADEFAGLERLADGLRTTTKPGPVAKDIADAFRSNANNTATEFKVIRDRLAQRGTPEQVKALNDDVRAELSAEDRQRFDTLVAGTDKGDGASPPKDDGGNPTFNRFRERLKPREGGFANRKGDPGGPTQKGISQEFLNKLNKQHPEWELPKDSKELNKGQIDGIYRSEFFDKPKIQKVQDIPGLKKQAPQLPEQLFDAGVLHGPKQAGQWLQQSLDERLGTDLRTPDKNGNLVYDGNVGPKTRAAIGQATKNGKIQAINNAMVDRRVELMRKLPDFTDNPGWLPRANRFRIGE